jgi:hypothetical protein
MARLSRAENGAQEPEVSASQAAVAPILPEPCPWLPQDDGVYDAWHHRCHFPVKDAGFYVASLSYAQALWLHGKPAQAILQLNKAWTAELTGDEKELFEFPAPYRALVWLVDRAKGGEMGFIGNPLRHFQHLATRVSGPNRELRSWRAWACFWLMVIELEGFGYDRDGVQIAKEGLWIPSRERVRNEIFKRGWRGEEVSFSEVLRLQNGE